MVQVETLILFDVLSEVMVLISGIIASGLTVSLSVSVIKNSIVWLGLIDR